MEDVAYLAKMVHTLSAQLQRQKELYESACKVSEQRRKDLAEATARFDLLNEFYTCDADEEPDEKLAANTKGMIEQNVKLRAALRRLVDRVRECKRLDGHVFDHEMKEIDALLEGKSSEDLGGC